jgi:hypothetical protein
MDKPITQLTQDELLDKLRTSNPRDFEKYKAEIHRRIRVKNSEPHEDECICIDCVNQE